MSFECLECQRIAPADGTVGQPDGWDFDSDVSTYGVCCQCKLEGHGMNYCSQCGNASIHFHECQMFMWDEVATE